MASSSLRSQRWAAAHPETWDDSSRQRRAARPQRQIQVIEAAADDLVAPMVVEIGQQRHAPRQRRMQVDVYGPLRRDGHGMQAVIGGIPRALGDKVTMGAVLLRSHLKPARLRRGKSSHDA
jgi:hypothetical protein